jgi:hypothetical protein
MSEDDFEAKSFGDYLLRRSDDPTKRSPAPWHTDEWPLSEFAAIDVSKQRTYESLKTQLRWIRNPNVGDACVAAALGSAPAPSLKAKHRRPDPGRQSVSQHESAAGGALFAPPTCDQLSVCCRN